MAASMKVAVFWDVAPCSLVEVLPDYMALQPRRQPSYIMTYSTFSVCTMKDLWN
jgi:hypothetical protein